MIQMHQGFITSKGIINILNIRSKQLNVFGFFQSMRKISWELEGYFPGSLILKQLLDCV